MSCFGIFIMVLAHVVLLCHMVLMIVLVHVHYMDFIRNKAILSYLILYRPIIPDGVY